MGECKKDAVPSKIKHGFMCRVAHLYLTSRAVLSGLASLLVAFSKTYVLCAWHMSYQKGAIPKLTNFANRLCEYFQCSSMKCFCCVNTKLCLSLEVVSSLKALARVYQSSLLKYQVMIWGEESPRITLHGIAKIVFTTTKY